MDSFQPPPAVDQVDDDDDVDCGRLVVLVGLPWLIQRLKLLSTTCWHA